MNIKFEFDPNKSETNKEKHGTDFIEAEKLWEDKNLLIIPAKNVKGEKRFALIGSLNGKCWICIFTLRNNAYRIISVRRCRKKEEELYEKKSKRDNR